MLTPDGDGISHINIYSQAKTYLGQALSNFATFPIVHPDYGRFLCLEGYWHYLSTGCLHDDFKLMNGYQAKSKSKITQKIYNPSFQVLFTEGLQLKLQRWPSIHQALIINELPLRHYYVFGHGECQKINDVSKKYQWLLDFFNDYKKQTLNRERI